MVLEKIINNSDKEVNNSQSKNKQEKYTGRTICTLLGGIYGSLSPWAFIDDVYGYSHSTWKFLTFGDIAMPGMITSQINNIILSGIQNHEQLKLLGVIGLNTVLWYSIGALFGYGIDKVYNSLRKND